MAIRLVLIAFFWVLTVACPLYFCPEAWVRFTQRSNQVCDLDCMTVLCGVDTVAPLISPCLVGCETHCVTSRLGNGICDSGKD